MAPEDVGMDTSQQGDRFWSKVDRTDKDKCWPWNAARNEHNYGVFRLPATHGGKTAKAHRVAYLLHYGELAEEAVVRHSCDNPICCNPHHLVPGSQAQNIADMHGRKRRLYKSKLDSKGVTSVRKRYAGGESQTSIARSYGCTQPYISMLLSDTRGNSIKKGITHGTE